jgi:acylphosphatase
LLAAAFGAGVWVGRTWTPPAPSIKPADREPAPKPQETPATPRPESPARIITDAAARSVSVPACALKQGKYRQLVGAVEYALVATGGKEYESLFKTEHRAAEIHAALRAIGLRPGQAAGRGLPPRGMPVRLFVEVRTDRAVTQRPIEDFLVVRRTSDAEKTKTPDDAVTPRVWLFAGAAERLSPDTRQRMALAALTQSIIGLEWGDPSSLVQNPDPGTAEGTAYVAHPQVFPEAGTPVRIVFQRPPSRAAPGARRVYVRVAGRVRHVGYRTFVRGRARRLGVGGFIRNLPGSEAEALLEGPAEATETLLGQMKQGPLAARVETVETADEPPEGDLAGFDIWY